MYSFESYGCSRSILVYTLVLFTSDFHFELFHCKLSNSGSWTDSRQVLHFCMCNFVSADTAMYNWDLSVETKLHIRVQKYDGLENMEKPGRALEVYITLGSSTDTNLSHNHTKV